MIIRNQLDALWFEKRRNNSTTINVESNHDVHCAVERDQEDFGDTKGWKYG